MKTFKDLNMNMIGDSRICMAVRVKARDLTDIFSSQLMKAITFVREPFLVNNVEPGSMPLSAVSFHFNQFTRETYHIVAAYRCQQCRTLFVVPKVEDLAHACTQEN